MNKIIIEQVAKHRKEAETLVRAFYDHPEISMEETASSRAIVDALAPYGFTIEYPFMEKELGYDTAFRATLKRGEGPKCSIMVEYDALPGIGHGCGHNLLGTAALAGAVAVKSWLEQHGGSGTVRFYGCPGEEGGSGKTFMVREGLFDDVDAAVTWHPEAFAGMFNVSTLANIQAAWRFHGVAAHAANSPHLGRSALDAVTEAVQIGRAHV